jgi:hypothetical protein
VADGNRHMPRSMPRSTTHVHPLSSAGQKGGGDSCVSGDPKRCGGEGRDADAVEAHRRAVARSNARYCGALGNFLNVLDIVVTIVLIVSTAPPTHAGSVSLPDEDRRVIKTAAVHVQGIRLYYPSWLPLMFLRLWYGGMATTINHAWYPSP